MLFNVRKGLCEEHLLIILVPFVRQGQPAAVVSGPIDEVVVHHDDERFNLSFRYEIIGNDGGKAGVCPFRLVLSGSVLEVEDRVMPVRLRIIAGGGVDIGPAPFPFNLGVKPVFADIPVRNVPHEVIFIFRRGDLYGTEPTVGIGEFQSGIRQAGTVHNPPDKLVTHLGRLSNHVPSAFRILLRREFLEGEFQLHVLGGGRGAEAEPVLSVRVNFGEFGLALCAGGALPTIGGRWNKSPLGVCGADEQVCRGNGKEKVLHWK